MKKSVRILFTSLSLFLGAGVLFNASAQSLLPNQITNIFGLLGSGGAGAAGFVTSRVQLGLVIALGAVVLIAVVYAIIAAFKYIQSQGDSGKIEEAQKAIKAIFLGVGAMLIAIVGIVLVFVFFGATQPDPSLFQTCLSAPNSPACQVCIATPQDPVCTECEAAYEAFARDGNEATLKGVQNGACVEPLKAP